MSSRLAKIPSSHVSMDVVDTTLEEAIFISGYLYFLMHDDRPRAYSIGRYLIFPVHSYFFQVNTMPTSKFTMFLWLDSTLTNLCRDM